MPFVTKVCQTIKSVRLALGLIAIITLTVSVSVIYAKFYGDQSVQNIYRSWWFLAISFLLLINLFACTLGQILRSKPKKTGTILLHAGLILVLTGSFVTNGFGMSGYMTIAEGESRSESHNHYDFIEEGYFFKEAMHGDFGLELVEIKNVFNEQNKFTGALAKLKLTEGIEEYDLALTDKNQVSSHGMAFRLAKSGFAPKIIISGEDGQAVFESYVLLDTIGQDEGRRSYTAKSFTAPGIPYKFDFEFYPGAGNLRNGLGLPDKPGIQITVWENGNQVTGRLIQEKNELLIPGYSLSFDDLKLWAGVELKRDPGEYVFYLGFIIAVIGTIMIYGLPLFHDRILEEHKC